jgi:peptidoglycan/xylan/chitin deacetylase (PgdA/CDA1 family)
MYHQILANPTRVYDRTPAQFRAELQVLYDEGYRPITTEDLVTGRIDLPAGRHPVVLTLDDSTISQAQIGADGQPTPDSALGMLEAFGREHPDFHPTATYYVNTVPEPFVDPKVLPWLAAHGYEFGAHTRSHADLRVLSDAGVQAEIGGNIADIQKAVPGYTVTTLAIPFGHRPANRDLAHTGVHDGVAYDLAGVAIVNPVPSPSPFSVEFDRYRVARIGAEDTAVPLESLRRHPERRFTSDGDPATISFPARRAGELAPAWADKARPY